MDKLNELELKKAQLEQAFEEKGKQARALTNDIWLLEQLLTKKNELNDVVGAINAIKQEYDEVCKGIEEAKKEEVKEETA